MRAISPVLPLVLVASLALAGCGSNGSTTSNPPSSKTVVVVAGENFWGNILDQIGGKHVNVISIISDPTTDPHQYESDAATAAAIAGAQLIVKNGVGYDNFIDKLTAASPNTSRQEITVASILHISGDNPNPHLWYDTALIPTVAAAFAKELSKLDPADRSAFAANEKTFDESLKPISAEIAKIKSTYPGAPIAYTERVPGYLVQAAGLVLATPASFAQSIEDGSDPSAADTASFQSALLNNKVKVLLYNGQVTNPATVKLKQLASQQGIPVIGVTETLPPKDKNFQAWQLRQVTEIYNGLSR